MLKREITEKLISWKNQEKKKALCIIGARQIGKTTIIREFAKEQYEHFVEAVCNVYCCRGNAGCCTNLCNYT